MIWYYGVKWGESRGPSHHKPVKPSGRIPPLSKANNMAMQRVLSLPSVLNLSSMDEEWEREDYKRWRLMVMMIEQKKKRQQENKKKKKTTTKTTKLKIINI